MNIFWQYPPLLSKGHSYLDQFLQKKEALPALNIQEEKMTFLFLFIYHRLIGLVGRVFASGPGDLGSRHIYIYKHILFITFLNDTAQFLHTDDFKQ